MRISAIIPTYNRSNCIARAIESVLAQELAAADVIVVDDGSTDDTRIVVAAYGSQVRYVHQNNRGVSAARNRGVHETESEWIAFLDSDDYWTPGHLARIAHAVCATETRAALYFANTRLLTGGVMLDHWQRCGLEVQKAFEFKADASEWVFLPTHPMLVPSSVIYKASYLDIGGFCEQLRTREDTLLFFKLGLRYPACAVSGYGAVVTPDGDARLTTTYNARSLQYRQSSVMLYTDLSMSTYATSASRQLVADRLAESHYILGRMYLKQRRYRNALKSFCASYEKSSIFLAHRLLRLLVRSLRRMTRDQ